MSLIVIWGSFIISVSYFEELNQYQYLFFSSFMLCLTYFYNQISIISLSLKIYVSVFNIPSLILWYMAFVYNDFLAINPISYELFTTMFFIYAYLILWIIGNSDFK